MSILVIGGRGLIGLHTSRRFLRQGYPVIIYDLYTGDTSEELSDFFDGVPPPTYVAGDAGDTGHLLEIIDRYKVEGGVNASIAYGGSGSLKDPVGSFKTTVEATLSILEAARARDLRMVFVSTQAVYGPRPDLKPISEDDPVNPTGIYPCWKAMHDLMCLTYHSVFDVDLVVIRTSGVYGPLRRTRPNLGVEWLRKALAGESVEEPDGADHEMDWTYAEDLAQGIYLAYTTRPIEHRLFNISQGKNVTFRELAQTIMDLVPGSSIKLGPGISQSREKNDVAMRGPGDITHAKKELGYDPKYTVHTGFAELLGWLKSKGKTLSVLQKG